MTEKVTKTTVKAALLTALLVLCTPHDKRNKKWAKDIASFIEDGGITFIFSGCGHRAGKNSVFEYLRRQGTIE